MSMSDSDFLSHGGEYRNFLQISRERLLHEMLRSGKKDDSKLSWKVLIMDKVTVKVMSCSCKMADITDEGISLVEDLFRRRQPLPSMDAIYFIQPSKENVVMFLSDMSGRVPLYKKAFVFFSSPVPKELLNHIKCDSSVLPRIGALREMNLEYFSVDSQGFITDHELALEELFGGNAENSRKFDTCLNVMATRIATVFASLKIPSKTGGQSEKKEVILEDHDPVWHELRHAHIADASERLHEKMTNFVSKNKAAQIQQGSRDGSELSTRDLQKMVQALPQYNDQMDKLSLHVEIAGKINRLIREMGLRELGQLEQDLVFGDAGTKEVINFLRSKQDATPENKLRLLMIYASIHPDKFEGDKASKLMQLARLSPDDMKAVKNMSLLAGPSEAKKTSIGSFALKFDAQKRKHAARKDRTGEEETWQLSRFYPMIEELIEKLNKGELPKNEYLCMNEPTPTPHVAPQSSSSRSSQGSAPHSMRSRRTATWARHGNSDDGCSSDSILKTAANDYKKMGQRIFVFIIGGATRSELRVCHKLTTKLRREIVLGSSSFDDPPQYVTKLKLLSEKELSLDSLKF
ncbi:SNARE-interacting protein KEULE-like isoform X3 [Malania oleifera]|uniref:SNARE-interacting protein KEULE-like isoform X3 n=1 Tax=Malania oleifera TaxID=397392 RepID=UPI0025ADD568|nr:SNARE-interacting protein KEULE-like isoform X3 [Malania oleifera]